MANNYLQMNSVFHNILHFFFVCAVVVVVHEHLIAATGCPLPSSTASIHCNALLCFILYMKSSTVASTKMDAFNIQYPTHYINIPIAGSLPFFTVIHHKLPTSYYNVLDVRKRRITIFLLCFTFL